MLKMPTEFSQFIYNYCQLRKDDIPPDVLSDLIEGLRVRNNKTFVLVDTRGSEWGTVVTLRIPPASETILFYDEWRSTFSNHGYHAPLLDIEYIN